MPLIDRIERALDAGVDSDVFERAAMALLSSKYRWISPVEAGKDLGRDGDIYRVSPGGPAARGRVLATTGDPLRNLKSSHRSWKTEADFRVDQLVIACARDITHTMRKRIETYCADNALPVPEFYGRDWFVEALRKSPEWREILTGVKGRLDALMARPPALVPGQGLLVGRDEDLRRLRERIPGSRDIVLSGVPGVGKTRLLIELGGLVLFVEPAAQDYLADDLVAMTPAAVVLDDAHLHAEILAHLVRLRIQEGLSFQVVACTWPHHSAEVVAALPSADVVAVDLLPRTDVDAIIRNDGITGVRARLLLLEQAQGRPGWARTLCSAVVDGDGERVVSGEVLLNQVVRHLTQMTESAETLDAVACIAALGGASLDELDRVASLLRVPTANLVGAVDGLATAGMLEQGGGRWRLQEALVAPLVGRWFFGRKARRPWRSITDAFPDRADDLTRSLLRAARVAAAPDLTREVTAWANRLSEPSRWDPSTIALVHEYATASEAAADFASKSARLILSTDREPETSLWGTRHDPVGDAASALLVACARHWVNEEAVHGLLDLALSDDRPRHQHPDPPLRVLGDIARHLDPDQGPIFEVRRRILRYSKHWLLLRNSGAQEWPVFCEVVRSCLSPEVEGTWSDPAAHRSITLASGVETSARLRELIGEWGGVAATLGTQVPEQVPPAAVRELLGVFEDWLRLAAGHARGSAAVLPDQREAGLAGAWAIYETLRPILQAHPGLAVRARREIELAGRWSVRPPEGTPPLVLDDELVLLMGIREPWDSAEDWIEQRDADQVELARRLALLGPELGTARFVELVTQSATTDSTDGAGYVALQLARLVDAPEAWAIQAVRRCSPDLLYHALRDARLRGRSLDTVVLLVALDTPLLRGALVRAVLDGTEIDSLASAVLGALRADDAWALEGLFTKDGPDEVMRLLLAHPVPAVRANAAVAFAVGVKHGPELPEEWRPAWRQALLEADGHTVHGHGQWRLQGILKAAAGADPDTCVEWFERRISTPQRDLNGPRLSEVEGAVTALPQSHRERLARLCASGPGVGQTLMPHLIGQDIELAARLLDEGVLDRWQVFGILTGERDAGAQVLAPLLLAHGFSAEEIAQQICASRSWRGNESDAIKGDIAWFVEFSAATPAAAPVCAAAIERLERERARALAEERIEAIRGWS